LYGETDYRPDRRHRRECDLFRVQSSKAATRVT
jgi:hypothetical protein